MTDEKYTVDSIIPEDMFGRDHWTTLAYIETRLTDYGRYIICCDARMRTDAHNRRIFMYRPGKQTDNLNRYMIAQIGRPCSPTRLRDGSEVPGHDDWDCLMDMAKAGYIVGDALRYPFRGMRKPIGIGSAAARAELAALYREQIDPTGVDLGARIKLTPRGFQVVGALRRYKAQGGTFATFQPPPPDIGGNNGKSGIGSADGSDPPGADSRRRQRRVHDRGHRGRWSNAAD